MQKLVFLFGRAPGLSHAAFARHYLEVHAPLGLRVTRAMERYVVNLADVDGPPQPFPVDAITEIWTPSADVFFDPSRAFTSPDDGRALMADHQSFIGPMHAYAVEERVVEDGTATGVKYVCLRPARDATSATRHVEDRVVRTFTPDAPPVEGFTFLRFADRDAANAFAATNPGFLVTEHVQKA
ncbi:MAG TPA: EthD domain-containing protein [Acidimicrobiia bacterium]|nr:EthD domain-containing protein [Acidimicrobiia bacterium]